MISLYQTDTATFHQVEGEQGQRLLKVLRASDPSAEEAFELENELQMAKQSSGVLVRQALGRAEHEGRAALHLSYFAGETLAQLLASGTKLSLSSFYEIALCLTRAVEELHAQGTVHRAISPESIVVDPGLHHTQLTDLQHATRLARQEAFGRDVRELGKRLVYAAPEQTGRMNRKVDARSDLYALGVVFYEVLAGHPPFRSDDPLKLMHQHLAAPPPPLPSEVPEGLGAVVFKLLAKDPEHRYQSAHGLLFDLERCEAGKGASFELGAEDRAGELRLPDRLHGREREVRTLSRLFEQASNGNRTLLLIDGPAGVGKSALVREVLRPQSHTRGCYIAGKFDQYNRDLPYRAWIDALSQYADQALTESGPSLEELRTRLDEVIGDLADVVLALLPSLAPLFRRRAPLAQLRPQEEQARFRYVMLRFLRAIAPEGAPLVLFLDDLQWADAASLDLLGAVMADPESHHLLIVGAYRPGEVDAAHPLTLLLRKLEGSPQGLSRLGLAELDRPAVTALLADMLGEQEARLASLAEHVEVRSGGNPLFVLQLLSSLRTDGKLSFHRSSGHWEWDLDNTPAATSEIDLLALLAERMQRLPEPTLRLLTHAAFLGNRFNLQKLQVLGGDSVASMAADLWPAIDDGLVLPVGEAHFVAQAGVSIEARNVHYVFSHDRIQQALYGSGSHAERDMRHHALGEALANLRANDPNALSIFEVVTHKNLGRNLLTSQAERDTLAEENLRAGAAAKAAAAYSPSLAYLDIGIELLGGSPFSRSYSLCHALHAEAVAAAHLSAQTARMEELCTRMLQHGRTVLDKLPAYSARIDWLTAQNRLGDAVSVGLLALAELGERFPKKGALPHVFAGLGRTKLRLMGKDLPGLATQREMTDERKLEAMKLLERVVPAAYMSGSLLFPLFVFRMVDLSVKHGNSPLSPFGYASFAITLSGVLGDIDGGSVFAKLAVDTMHALGSEKLRVQVDFVIHVFIRHHTEHLEQSIEPLLEAFRVGMSSGNLVGATWSAYYSLFWKYYQGRDLGALQREAATYSAIFRQLEQHAVHRRCDLLRQVTLSLSSQTADPLVFSGEAYSDNEAGTLAETGDDKTTLFLYHQQKAFLHYLLGSTTAAQEHSRQASKRLDSVTGLPCIAFFFAQEGLILAREARLATGLARRQLVTRARARHKKLVTYAASAPQNYGHLVLLLGAELASLGGDHDAARDLYDQAIQAATKHRYTWVAAIASELACRLQLERGITTLAAHYGGLSLATYTAWGALAKANALGKELTAAGIGPTSQTHGSSAIALDLDVGSVVKAATAISQEIVLDQLLNRLLDVVMENAGATAAALVVLGEAGQYSLVGHKRAQGELKTTEAAEYPQSVMRFAQRSETALVLDSPLQDERFRRDEYLQRRAPESLMCFVMKHQGADKYVMYLEHDSARGVFTKERVELLRVLSGQMAVSLQNAALYRDLESALSRQVALTEAYSRFTPQAFLDALGRRSILDVELGDQTAGDMTVLFADIRGYTTLSEQMSAEDNFTFINRFLARTTPIVARHHGVVSRFLGDAIMAFFPRSADDALRASVDIQLEVKRYNEERVQKGRDSIRVGVGLHSGPLMIGIIGDADRMEPTLLSDTVNTASRMEGLTKDHGVCIILSAETRQRLRDPSRYQLRDLGDSPVRGRKELVRIYECQV